MSSKKYIVADGVDWINGKRVPADRVVHLTEREALYDLALGRVSEATEPRRSRAKPKTEEDEPTTVEEDLIPTGDASE